MKKTILAAVFLGLFLTGCASPAEMKNMVVNQSALVNAQADTPFKDALSIKQVDGGESTNPLWTSQVSNAGFQGALQGSLEQSGLLDPVSTGSRFDLEATLSKLDQPIFGLDMTVTSQINYRVVERSTMTTWFDEPVTASYTATFSDAPMGTQRLKLANEGSIKENLLQFIDRLLAVKGPPG